MSTQEATTAATSNTPTQEESKSLNVVAEQTPADLPKDIQKDEQDQSKENQENQQTQQQAEEQNNSNAPSQHPRKNRYLKYNYKISKNYDDLDQIVKAFPSLATLQDSPDIEGIDNALCYVIRSNNDDDVHKAIKYGIWTSVPGNNVKLNQAYQLSVQMNVDVYLFFSVVKSGQFIGVAKLKSSFQEETFSYWWQPHKFKGHFKIEWVFVKDVTQKAFEGLKNSQNDEISRSKDCTELKFDTTGKKMLQIYKDAPAKPNIFGFFQYLDQKEQILRNAYSYLGRQGNRNQNNYYNNGGYNNNARTNNQNTNGNNIQSQQQQQMNMMYPSYTFNPQYFQMNQAAMFQQYTPEQLSQISQMCFTNIYPPNTYPNFGNNQGNYAMPPQNNNNNRQKNFHSGNGNGNNNNNNYRRNNQNSGKKNYNNNKPNNNLPQQQQPKLSSENEPSLPKVDEQTA